MKVSTALLALLIALVAAGQLRAQQQPSAILEDRPDADADLHDPQLGPLFESLAAGIAFRPPADGQQIRRPGSGEEIVQYVNEKQKWTLRVSRMLLSEPVPLIIDLDASGKPRGGVLESMIAQLQLDAPGAQILRQDVINIGDVPVAMIAARTQLGLETRLRQQAILKDTEQSYYLFDMSSTAPAESRPRRLGRSVATSSTM